MAMTRILTAKMSKVNVFPDEVGYPFLMFPYLSHICIYCVGSAKASVSTSNNLQGCTGISKLGASKVEVLKKPSKFLKTSLVGLINDNKRSKVRNQL